MVFPYGAILMSATAGLREALYAIAVQRGDKSLDSTILQVISDGSQIAGATLGAWMAVALGSVAIVAHRTVMGWYAWLSTAVSVLASRLLQRLGTVINGSRCSAFR